MDDIQAQKAIWAYEMMIRRYRNPGTNAPEIHVVMNELNEAYDYLDAIPMDKITCEQERLLSKICRLLMRD